MCVFLHVCACIYSFTFEEMVRKLRGPVKKESKGEKRQRRRDNVQGKQRILTVAIPVLLGLLLMLVVVLWLKSTSPPS